MTSPAPANPATAAKNGTTNGAISIPAPNGTAQQASQFTEQQVQQMLPRLQQMFSGFTREKLAALVNVSIHVCTEEHGLFQRRKEKESRWTSDALPLLSLTNFQRAQQLQAINSDEQTHPELQNAMQTLRSFQTYQQLTQRPRSNPTSCEFFLTSIQLFFSLVLLLRPFHSSRYFQFVSSEWIWNSFEICLSIPASTHCFLLEWISNCCLWSRAIGRSQTSDRSLQDACS